MFNTKSKNLHFAHFDIAGFSYWEGCMVMNQLKIGDEVQLVREEKTTSLILTLLSPKVVTFASHIETFLNEECLLDI